MNNPLRLVKQFLRRRLVSRLGIPDMRSGLMHLRKAGIRPRVIFDVGAYRGDFAELALQIWPEAMVNCFEVQPEPLRNLESLRQRLRGIEISRFLLGAHSQEKVVLNLAETASSVLTEHIPNSFPKLQCSMSTIDQVIESTASGVVPDLIKLDVQGYELEVLKGAEMALRSASALVIEMNLLDIHKGVPLLSELVKWLRDRDWVIYDICGMCRRPLDGALWQLDAVCVPIRSPLRSDKRWAS